jgi:hypothetical protein
MIVKFMRRSFRIFLILVVGSFLFLYGCQKEIDETIEAPKKEVFTQGSSVADLVRRTVQKDGSADNIIDGSSCSSLILPVTVIVNEKEITLDTPDDFYDVELILDEFDNDDDNIEILFPVSVILSDHSELILKDEDDLEDLIDLCVEGGEDEDIECIDFKFPLNISVFDSENELSNVIIVNNDYELHEFIHDLDESDFASFRFPITILLSDGSEMTIENNDELEDIIENVIDECDEDDDNDYNDDDEEEDPEDTELFVELAKGEWIISYFFNESDKTSDFAAYKFTFNADGTALADNGSNQINGTWEGKSEDSGTHELELKFGETALFVQLEDDWDVLEFDGKVIKLMDEDTVEGSKRFLNLERP